MANIYVATEGGRALIDQCTDQNIGLSVCFRWCPCSGMVEDYQDVVSVTVSKTGNKNQWALAIQSALESWAAANGHTIQQIVTVDYTPSY
jgi:hypothetical protein